MFLVYLLLFGLAYGTDPPGIIEVRVLPISLENFSTKTAPLLVA